MQWSIRYVFEVGWTKAEDKIILMKPLLQVKLKLDTDVTHMY